MARPSLIWPQSSCNLGALRSWLNVLRNIYPSYKILRFWSHKSIVISLRYASLNILVVNIWSGAGRALDITWLADSFISIYVYLTIDNSSKGISIWNIDVLALVDNWRFLLLKLSVLSDIISFLTSQTLLKIIEVLLLLNQILGEVGLLTSIIAVQRMDSPPRVADSNCCYVLTFLRVISILTLISILYLWILSALFLRFLRCVICKLNERVIVCWS